MPTRTIRVFIVITLAASVIGCETDAAPANLSPPGTTAPTSTTEDSQPTQQDDSLDSVDLSRTAPTPPLPACTIIAESSRDQVNAFNCKLELI